MLGHTKTTNEDGTSTITVIYDDGSSDAMTSDHANFERLDDVTQNVPSSKQSETDIRNLINLTAFVSDRFRSLSERVSVKANTVFFDGDPLHATISDHILRLIKDGDDRGWRALVNFLEKLAQNPSDASKVSLYTYLTERNFTILPNGDFLAYKGCKWRNDIPVSIFAGPGIVNGVSMNGNLPNAVGNVIEMQRSTVDADVLVGCSVGLHAGTYEYARGFGQGVLLRVSINPRDVVSVPEDCEFQKLRICRYTVIEAEDKPYEATTYVSTDAYFDEDYASEAGYDEGYDAGYNGASYDDAYYGDFPDHFTDYEVDDFNSEYSATYEAAYSEGEQAREEEEEENEEDEDEDDSDDSEHALPEYGFVLANIDEDEAEEDSDDEAEEDVCSCGCEDEYDDEDEDDEYDSEEDDEETPVSTWTPRKPVIAPTAFAVGLTKEQEQEEAYAEYAEFLSLEVIRQEEASNNDDSDLFEVEVEIHLEDPEDEADEADDVEAETDDADDVEANAQGDVAGIESIVEGIRKFLLRDDGNRNTDGN